MKLIPKLAILGSPFRPLLNKKSILQWNENHTIFFGQIKQEIVNVTKNTPFRAKLQTRKKRTRHTTVRKPF